MNRFESPVNILLVDKKTSTLRLNCHNFVFTMVCMSADFLSLFCFAQH